MILKNNLNNILQALTPAEILFIKNPLELETKQLIILTFIDLYYRKILIVERKDAKFCNCDKTFFIKHSIVSTDEFVKLAQHEKILLKRIYPEKWMSLMEFGAFLSNYCNDIFRFFSIGYNFEKNILNSLVGKEYIKKNNSLFIFKLKMIVKKNPFTSKGMDARDNISTMFNEINEHQLIKIYKMIQSQDFDINELDIDENVIIELEGIISKEIDTRGYGSTGIAVWGKRYPIPLDL